MDLPRAAAAPPLEKLEAVGVEERAVAGWQVHPRRSGAVVDHAEQCQELRPGPVALVHRVRVERRILAQPFEETCQGIGAEERLVLGQHLSLLGIEEEDEAQDDGQERAVDLVGMLGQGLAQQLALRGVVRRLEAAEEFVEGVQHLLGEALGDLVLEFPAVGEERGEALVARKGQEPPFAEQQP